MSTALRRYLALEGALLAMDEDSPHADLIRDALDPVWAELTAEDKALINRRNMAQILTIEEVRLPVGSLYTAVPAAAPRRDIPQEPILDWRGAA